MARKARKDEKLAREARLACEKWREGFKINIDQYHRMHTFILGQQWTDEEEELLKSFKKVPMTANKLATMDNQMEGEQAENTPQLQVFPLSNCDEEVAKIREIIFKDIMFSDDATTATQVAGSQARIGGYSVLLADTEYAHTRSFEQNIVIRYLNDATRAYFDLGAELISKMDGDHCGYVSRMTRKKFRQLYGKELEEKISKTMSPGQTEEEIALAVQPSQGDDPFTWADNESITILNHYKRKYKKDTIYKLSSGNSYNQEELDEIIEKSRKTNKKNDEIRMISSQLGLPQSPDMNSQSQPTDEYQPADVGSGATTYDTIPLGKEEDSEEDNDYEVMTLWDNGEPVRIEEKKEIKSYEIMHYQIAGDYILDENEFPSIESLPMAFLDQKSYYDKNGKQICRPFFVDCIDTQRYINYIRTQSAFIIKVSRYDQFMGSKENVKSLDAQRNWKDPAAIQGMITYDESSKGYKPEQLKPPELSQSLFAQYQLALEDLYTSTGLYPARMGQEGSEVSGKAINARARQGSFPTSVPQKSVNRAIASLGTVINEMIPRVYDSQRVISLMMPDKGQQNITINKQSDDYGEHIENDIRKGTYQVRLKPGPSYEGQKELALTSLKEVLQVDPETFKLVADLFADNLPLANNIEIKNRLKTLVPPEIVEAGKSGKMPNENGQPNPQQQAMQAQQQMQQQEMKLKAQEVQIKAQELQLQEKEFELKKQEIILDAQFKIKELENKRLETAAQIKEQELRYAAETERTQADQLINHSDNLVSILTHRI